MQTLLPDVSGDQGIGRVAERLMAADCKSAAPCGLRRFESSPVHEAESPQRQRTIHGQRSSHPWERRELEGFAIKAHVAQLVERVLGKDEVTSSILVVGSR